MIETQWSQELTPAEALRLLAGVPFGRVIFTSHAMPAVRPVRHVVTDKEIVIAVGAELVLGFPSAAQPGPGVATVVAYQADQLDSTGQSGWSVVVIGRTRLITEPDEVRRYCRVLPAVTGPDQLVAISTELVTGFRLAEGHFRPALASA